LIKGILSVDGSRIARKCLLSNSFRSRAQDKPLSGYLHFCSCEKEVWAVKTITEECVGKMFSEPIRDFGILNRIISREEGKQMAKSLLRTDNEIAAIYTRHVKTIYRVCYTYMKNPADTEDAVSETFIKMIKSSPAFESEEHEKAWLTTTPLRVCICTATSGIFACSGISTVPKP
jgi:hypothetical protein